MTGFRSALYCCVTAYVLGMSCNPVSAETLDQALLAALNNHPSVASAIAGRDVSSDVVREKRSSYFPELSVNAATGRIYGDNSTSRGLTVDRGAGYSWNHEGGLSVRQMIFDGMETPNRVHAASARVHSSNEGINDVRETLALRAVMAYIDVLRTTDAYNLLSDHSKKIADYRQRIGNMVEQGAADESMSVQAHDIQNQMDSTLADVEGERNKALAEYLEVIGQPASAPMERPSLQSGLLPESEDEAVNAVKSRHPAIAVAALESKAANYDIAAEKGTLYPDISGEVSYFKKDVDDIIGGEVVDERALVRMNWNFSTGGAQLARINQAVHRQAESEARKREIEISLEREVRKAYAEMLASQKRWKASAERVDVSKNLVTTYEKQFEAAKVSILNLLQAENTHFNARLGALNADYRHLASQYSLLAATGRLQDGLNVKPATHD